MLASLDGGRGEGGERDDGRRGPRHVDAALWRGGCPRGVPPDQPEPGQPDGAVDEEDAPPAEGGDEQAADDRAAG